MRTRCSSFRMDSIDRAMVLLLDDVFENSLPFALAGVDPEGSNE